MTIKQLSHLADTYGTSIYSFCYHLTGNKHDADDLYQDTFLRAVELSEKLDTQQNPKSYLISIAVNLNKNIKRKIARRLRIAPVDDISDETLQTNIALSGNSPEDDFMIKEESYIIRRIVKSLPSKFSTVLYLYYTAELSVNEIATSLHIPIGTVKSRLYKARSMVKDYWEETGYDE